MSLTNQKAPVVPINDHSRRELLNLIEEHREEFSQPEWFKRWIYENYTTYKQFESVAIDLKHKIGYEKSSARLVTHILRWGFSVDGVKIPNARKGECIGLLSGATPYVSRLTMIAQPSLMGFFGTSKQTAKKDMPCFDLTQLNDVI